MSLEGIFLYSNGGRFFFGFQNRGHGTDGRNRNKFPVLSKALCRTKTLDKEYFSYKNLLNF